MMYLSLSANFNKRSGASREFHPCILTSHYHASGSKAPQLLAMGAETSVTKDLYSRLLYINMVSWQSSAECARPLTGSVGET